MTTRVAMTLWVAILFSSRALCALQPNTLVDRHVTRMLSVGASSSARAASCTDLPGETSGTSWFDGKNDCAAYSADTWCDKYGITDFNGEGKAKDKCCVCGGGRRCTDLPGETSGTTWFDGNNGCGAYSADTWCDKYGITDFNGEGKAKDKCCVCGGGRRDSGSKCKDLSTAASLITLASQKHANPECRATTCQEALEKGLCHNVLIKEHCCGTCDTDSRTTAEIQAVRAKCSKKPAGFVPPRMHVGGANGAAMVAEDKGCEKPGFLKDPGNCLCAEFYWGTPEVSNGKWNVDVCKPCRKKCENPIHPDYRHRFKVLYKQGCSLGSWASTGYVRHGTTFDNTRCSVVPVDECLEATFYDLYDLDEAKDIRYWTNNQESNRKNGAPLDNQIYQTTPIVSTQGRFHLTPVGADTCDRGEPKYYSSGHRTCASGEWYTECAAAVASLMDSTIHIPDFDAPSSAVIKLEFHSFEAPNGCIVGPTCTQTDGPQMGPCSFGTDRTVLYNAMGWPLPGETGSAGSDTQLISYMRSMVKKNQKYQIVCWERYPGLWVTAPPTCTSECGQGPGTGTPGEVKCQTITLPPRDLPDTDCEAIFKPVTSAESCPATAPCPGTCEGYTCPTWGTWVSLNQPTHVCQEAVCKDTECCVDIENNGGGGRH